MSIERIEGQGLVDAIEAMDGVVEAARAMTEIEQTTAATEAMGARLERYADYNSMDSYNYMGSADDPIANFTAAQDHQEVIRATLRPELQPTNGHITAENIANVQPMTGPGVFGVDLTAAGGRTNSTIADRIADIRLPDEPLQVSADPAIPLSEPIVSIRAEPQSTVRVTGSNLNFFTRSVPINWGYIDYGSRPIVVAKSKIKPKPILNPKMVTRRVLNMAEKGWVVK